jgi:hypothetical protein
MYNDLPDNGYKWLKHVVKVKTSINLFYLCKTYVDKTYNKMNQPLFGDIHKRGYDFQWAEWKQRCCWWQQYVM